MAFDFLELPDNRTKDKPRQTGQTMVIDMGYGPECLRDQLRVLGPYIDLIKIAVGSAMLYPRDLLIEKVKICEDAGVRPFLGGQFIEYVVSRHGYELMPRFMREANALGILAVEVSDNCIELTDEQRCDLIKMGLDAGLLVHGEVGSKESKVEISELVRQANIMLHAGCEVVLFEAAELVEAGVADEGALEAIHSSIPPEKTMIELPGPWIKGVSHSDVYETMKTILRIFGREANIGNVAIGEVMELECTRCGIGTAGPSYIF